MSGKPDLVLLGHISDAHGIRGEVLIKTHTGDPAAIAGYGPLSDVLGARSFKVSVVRVTPKGVVARIGGIADRTEAERLKGVELYAPRSAFPAADEEEFYHADLIGLSAVSTDGSPIGRVVDVVNYGASDLLEIRLEGGGKTELIPFTAQFVPHIDVASGRVTVNVPKLVGGDQDTEPAGAIVFRQAQLADVPAIVGLLADDELGRGREDVTETARHRYEAAFQAMADDTNCALIVGLQGETLVACAQLNVLHGLSNQGALRGQIEAVRVAGHLRGQGVGEKLIRYVIELARARGCAVVQLTSSNERAAAQRFYKRIGFMASHVGMKLTI